MNKNKIKFFLLGCVLTTFYVASINCVYANDSVDSLTVAEDTFKGISHCMHYHITGMCFWMKCSVVGCYLKTTLKVDQYVPDNVVSVYTQHDNNPWDYAREIEDPVFYKAGQIEMSHMTHFNLGSGGDENDNSPKDINNKFHEVDIIGNPALIILNDYSKLLLPSTAKPFVPYYSSLMDAYAWRFPALERFYPGSLIPGLDDVGTMILHDWGPLYPRNGYVNQPDDAKAGAVDAIRASSIITAEGQPHLYMPLSNNCGDHCKAYPVKQNSKNAQFQMIYPKAENQCVIFGGSDIGSLTPWEADASAKGHNRYVWILWRHYQGCVPDRGAKYLGSANF
ncbi:MAG: TIGR03756 family integrating conjugative element protein [Gammaproteobacteria bacterium CG_4_10_14_0_8_um_filter_38_16]|nr:MAG: TIGR03756 family integrating conjugative element protein [Gammaproteobacteria bacterium CG_4_10_14_0_8_um_filter_38_16]PJA04221.1 MAG: TIGR03756 family integrating conjugative element protein [Gammaproteobacteria bacterium CG_4_10_14_0_2_um_filter_38_22]PJB11056.1 MAG: TIGR03756 family integrating conjugative element protein [Gammaproteobacteria bacterium CG_4_9_14_3_um_filter_38_9]